MHSHEVPWFCVVLRGGYEERIRSHAHEHHAGNVLFCPANAPHAQRFGANESLKLLFTPSPAGLSFLNDEGVALDDAPHRSSRAFARLGAHLAGEIGLNDSYSSLAIENLALEMMAAFARTQNGRDMPEWLAEVREILEDDADPSSLEELAARVERHPVHLAREFRRHFGLTVGAYLRRKRVAHAAILLRASRMPLAEIALACGYAGQASFARAFKAVHGVTPSVYRAR